MTNTSQPADRNTAENRHENQTGNDNSRFDRLSASDLRGLIDRIALAALVLLALIAGWNAYGYVGTAIRTWLDPAYQPIALAAFNVAVLLAAAAGAIHQLRRLRDTSGAGGPDADVVE